MMQGLGCVALRPEVHNYGRQHNARIEIFSIFAIQIILYALKFATQCSANPASYYKPVLRLAAYAHLLVNAIYSNIM